MQFEDSSRLQSLSITLLLQLCLVWPKGDHTHHAILVSDLLRANQFAPNHFSLVGIYK